MDIFFVVLRIFDSFELSNFCTLSTMNNTCVFFSEPPNTPEIYLSLSPRGDRIYVSGDRLEISCIARSGRPAANLSLYLGMIFI